MKLILNEEPRVTDGMMTLRGLMEKSSDADVLREMFGYGAQRLSDNPFISL